MVPFRIILLISILFYCGESFPQKFPNIVVDSLLNAGIKETTNQNYDDAKSTFIELDKKFPELPLGKIYITTVYITQSFDYSTEFKIDSINNYLNEAREEAKILVNKDDKNIWNRYSLAFAEGIYAYFQALNKNWISAFTNGFSSISDFQKCLELDPKFYDAYTAIGTYKYWRSRKTQVISWLPFVPDEKEEGIKYLKTAIERASYTKYLAINSLIWIYIDKKDYKNAEELAIKALNKFPNNRQFKLEYARALEETDPLKAIQLYTEVLNSYMQIKGLNRCNEIRLKHIIAQQYNKIGDYKMSLKLCDEILSINNLTDYEKENLSARIDRVKKLQEKLLKELPN